VRLRFNPFPQTHLIRIEKVNLIAMKADGLIPYFLLIFSGTFLDTGFIQKSRLCAR
jgi:hypothetical protein